MSAWGMGWPNAPLELDDRSRLAALGLADTLVLDAQLADVGDTFPRVHLRLDVRGSLDLANADADAKRAAILCQGRRIASVRSRNEPQFESPGETPERWCAYQTCFVRTFKQFCPNAPVFIAAVSPSGNWLPWLDASVQAAKESSADGLDAHTYGNVDELRAALAPVRQRWQGRLLVSEFNFGPGPNRVINLPGYAMMLPEIQALFSEFNVEAAVWFIWRWTNPDLPVSTRPDAKGTAIEQYFLQETKKVATQQQQFTVGQGVRDEMAKRADQPKTDEHYLGQVCSITQGQKGVYLYFPQSNSVSFLPAQ